jgi:glycosyltransferase involved in cell wall biosynthesis
MDVLGFGLAESMAQSHDVHMFVPGAGATDSNGYSVHRPWNGLDRRVGRLARRLYGNDPSRPVSSTVWPHLGYTASVAASARRHRLEILHIHIYDQIAPPVHRISPSTKLVAHLHDHSQTQRDRAMVGRHLAACDAIVGCSGFIASAAKERFPELTPRMSAIPNATHVPSEPVPPSGHPGIVFVGRISPEKGVHVLAKAFRRVHERFPDAQLTLIGPQSPAPREFVDPFGNDPLFAEVDHVWGGRRYADYVRESLGPALARTRMLGGVSHGEIGPYLAEASILVMPSLWDEPFGMPTIEAMAVGRAVVATHGGAFGEIVDDGITGNFVEKGGVEELAAILLDMLESPAQTDAMGVAGHARAQELFSWDDYVDRWNRLYDTLED